MLYLHTTMIAAIRNVLMLCRVVAHYFLVENYLHFSCLSRVWYEK